VGLHLSHLSEHLGYITTVASQCRVAQSDAAHATFAEALALSYAGDHAGPAFPSAALISPRRASMLGRAAAVAAAASAAATSPSAAMAADGPFRSPTAAGLSQAAQTWLPAGAASTALSPVPGIPSSPAAMSAQGREPRRTRRDSVRSGLDTAASAAAGAPPDVSMGLAVSPRRQGGGNCGSRHLLSIDPRGVSEPVTPGRGSGEARSPLRGGDHAADQSSLSPRSTRGFTAAELRAYEVNFSCNELRGGLLHIC